MNIRHSVHQAPQPVPTLSHPPARSANEQAAAELLCQIAQRDAQIAQLEAELQHLPELLSSLAGHPILWLVLGRDGIDQPGAAWSTLVGQQVVTQHRLAWRLMLMIGTAMFVLGGALGVAIAWHW